MTCVMEEICGELHDRRPEYSLLSEKWTAGRTRTSLGLGTRKLPSLVVKLDSQY